jgi:hypothetical protein
MKRLALDNLVKANAENIWSSPNGRGKGEDGARFLLLDLIGAKTEEGGIG